MSQDKPLGLTQSLIKVLRENPTRSYSMGELMAAAGIVKTSAAEVSSALHKLRNRALVKTVRGETAATSGAKFVRRYMWAAKPVVQARVQVKVQTVAVSPLQMLGVGRIR